MNQKLIHDVVTQSRTSLAEIDASPYRHLEASATLAASVVTGVFNPELAPSLAAEQKILMEKVVASSAPDKFSQPLQRVEGLAQNLLMGISGSSTSRDSVEGRAISATFGRLQREYLLGEMEAKRPHVSQYEEISAAFQAQPVPRVGIGASSTQAETEVKTRS